MRRWLVPYDFSPASEEAAARAAAELAPRGGEVILLYVYPSADVEDPEGADLRAGALQATPRAASLVDVARRLQDRHPGLFVDARVLAGNVVDVVLRAVASFDVERLAIGSTRQGGLTQLLFGSTAERIVRRSPVPVLVVKYDEERVPAA